MGQTSKFEKLKLFTKNLDQKSKIEKLKFLAKIWKIGIFGQKFGSKTKISNFCLAEFEIMAKVLIFPELYDDVFRHKRCPLIYPKSIRLSIIDLLHIDRPHVIIRNNRRELSDKTLKR